MIITNVVLRSRVITPIPSYNLNIDRGNKVKQHKMKNERV